MRNLENIHVRKIRRTYDKEAGKFTFRISYETTAQLTPRSLVVAEAFGLGIEDRKFKILDTELTIGPKDIVYICGDSGSGKSILLRAIKSDLKSEAIDLSEIIIQEDKPLIETIGKTVEEGLQLLSEVGLNDAFLFLRTYDQLSDGQKYRYRIAKLIETNKQWWLMDEFCATLDRDTAKIIAFNLQKIARQRGKAAIVATTHEDLLEDLAPSVHVIKRLGEEIHATYFTNTPRTSCSLLQEMKIEPGTLDDWKKLSMFHYRGHNLGARRGIFTIKRKNQLCGIIIYCYPPPRCAGRRLKLQTKNLDYLNKELCTISRIVIHPKFRSIGLAQKLIRETLPLIGTTYVEMVAVMPLYNPFAERAGMEKVTFNPPSKPAVKISWALNALGFSSELLSSDRYVRDKLETLPDRDIEQIRQAFTRHPHPRFKKTIAGHHCSPYGTTKLYRQALAKANIDLWAKLIKIVAVLLQAKVYLFWKRPEDNNQVTNTQPWPPDEHLPETVNS